MIEKWPVVFVPGYPASELWRKDRSRRIFPPDLGTLLSGTKRARFIDEICNGDLIAGEPIREAVKFIAKQAQSLYDILRDYGYSVLVPNQTFVPFGWDWRKGIDDSVALDDLESAIRRACEGAPGRCVVLAHSTGGLVLRYLLETRPQVATRIERILAMGIPWAGTLKAFRFVSFGERFGIWKASLSPKETRFVMRHAQAAFDLFPPAVAGGAAGGDIPPALFVDALNRPSSPLMERSWIDEDHALVDRGCDAALRLTRKRDLGVAGGLPPITNIVGWGLPTEVFCQLDQAGRPAFSHSLAGDGTVPLISSSWVDSSARTYYLPIGLYTTGQIPKPHSQIWDSPPMLEIFDQVLKDKEAEPFVAIAVEPDDVPPRPGRSIRLRISAADEKGNPLRSGEITFDGLQQVLKKTLAGVRDEVSIPPSILRPVISGSFHRFVAIVSWKRNGVTDRREVPIMFRR